MSIIRTLQYHARNLLGLQPLQIGEVLILDFGGDITVDYDMAKEDYDAGLYDGVIFRATSAGKLDDNFKLHTDGFGSREIPFGLYGWANPQSSAGQNAAQGSALVGAYNYVGKRPLLWVWGDWETNYSNLGVNDYRLAVGKYTDTYQQGTGDVLGSYTNVNYWDSWVANTINGNTDFPNTMLLWDANWRASAPPLIPYDWRKIKGTVYSSAEVWANYPDKVPLWQYVGSKWNVRWASKPLDASTFNGTHAEFVSFFNLTGVPIPPPPPVAEGVQLQVVRNVYKRVTPDYPNGKVLDTLTVGTKVNVIGLDSDVNGVWANYETDGVEGWSAVYYMNIRYMDKV
jgi:hypothetical protein